MLGQAGVRGGVGRHDPDGQLRVSPVPSRRPRSSTWRSLVEPASDHLEQTAHASDRHRLPAAVSSDTANRSLGAASRRGRRRDSGTRCPSAIPVPHSATASGSPLSPQSHDTSTLLRSGARSDTPHGQATLRRFRSRERPARLCVPCRASAPVVSRRYSGGYAFGFSPVPITGVHPDKTPTPPGLCPGSRPHPDSMYSNATVEVAEQHRRLETQAGFPRTERVMVNRGFRAICSVGPTRRSSADR